MTDLSLGYEPDDATAAFSDILRRWSDDDLEQASLAVRELVDHPGYRVLHRLIRERGQRTMRMLVGGGVTKEGVYYVGWLKWLSGMEQMLLAPEIVEAAQETRTHENAKAQAEAERAEGQAA